MNSPSPDTNSPKPAPPFATSSAKPATAASASTAPPPSSPTSTTASTNSSATTPPGVNPDELQAILDLETLATCPRATITEAAILVFHPATFQEIDHLEIDIEVASQVALGRTLDPETIAHRRRNRTLDRVIFTGGHSRTLADALTLIDAFLIIYRPTVLWIWGKDFDGPILADAGASLSRPFRVPYWQRRCARDAYKQAFGQQQRGTAKPHNALQDCRVTLQDLAAVHGITP